MAELLDYHYKGSQKDNKFRQGKSLFLKLGPRKVGGLLLTLLVMLVLPVTLIAVQQRQNTKQRAAEITGLGCPIDFTDANTPSLACLNRTYCITRGDGATTFNSTAKVLRQEFIAFIARYHLQVKKDWAAVDPNNTTEVSDATLFTDVPRTHVLAKEIYTAKKYGWIKGDGVGFNPTGDWTFGFHGIVREGSTTNAGAATPDCYSGCYTFSTPGGTITRGTLIDQMYEFGKSNADLVTCLITPTVTPSSAPTQSSATATPVPSSEPIVSGPNPLGCSQGVSYPASYNASYPLLKSILSCLNKSYCVVQGNSHVELNADNLGYNTKLTRSQYVTFITRYHTEVLKDDWKAAYDTIGDYYKLPSTKRFYDVSADEKNPNYHLLWREIYTSQKMGFIVGFEDNTFKPEGLWRYGFHGITRQDSYNGSYNFATMGNPTTRGEFLTLLYDYGLNVKKQLTSCIPTPTPTHANFPSPSQTGTPIPTSTPTRTPTPLIPTSTSTPTPSPTIAGSSIVVYAEGTVAGGVYPTMDLYIKGVIAKRWTNVTEGIKAYTYTSPTVINKADIKVQFSNDAYISGKDRNLRVDKVQVNGVFYEIEATTTYSTGSYNSIYSSCGTGYRKTEWLNCNGYFQL